MGKRITPDWVDWIRLNIQRGCDKDGIFRILLEEGFSRNHIVAHMNYEPVVHPNDKTRTSAKRRRREIIQDKGQFSRKVALSAARIYLPNARKLPTDLAEFYVLDDFLNQRECEELSTLITSRLRASEIAETDEKDSSFRTSRTCDLGYMSDSLTEDIDRRIRNMIGIDASYSEMIQGQYYRVGQEFKAHTDYFEADQFAQYAALGGQRTYTFFIYLNDVEEGGETEFPELGISMKPHRGRALVWNNLTEQGVPNPNTIHRAKPVLSGHKCVITKWFRANGSGPMYTKEPNEYIPNFTKEGFKRSRLDPSLQAELVEFYRQNRDHARDEIVEGGFITSTQSSKPSSLVELPDEIRARIHASLSRELSEWSGVDLAPTYVYGIRTYHRGAILKTHRDRLQTHVISAVINIDQVANKPWPLLIEDNYYRRHYIYLQPGEVLFYEGARLAHGRPEAFDGTRFANVFCHYIPA